MVTSTVEPVLESAAAQPSAAVRPWASRYLGYRMERFPAGIHVGMPSHRLTFIISLDEPVDLAAMPDRRQAPRRVQSPVSGLHAGPAEIAHDGNQYGIAIDVTPLGARALLGLPAGVLAHEVVDLPELLGPAARSLPERLADLPGWPQRFALLDATLARSITGRPDAGLSVAPEVAEAFRLIVASGGGIDIARVAREVGWSRRHLSERFRHEVGLAPKATARLTRFERATRLLEATGAGPGRPAQPESAAQPGPAAQPGRPGPAGQQGQPGPAAQPGWPGRTLADVAAAAGYADQAHFTREFRALAGRTPTRWLAEELPSVQDPDQVAVAP